MTFAVATEIIQVIPLFITFLSHRDSFIFLQQLSQKAYIFVAKSLSTKRRFQVCKRRSSRADLAREFQMCGVPGGCQKALWSHPLCLNEQETSRRENCRVAAAAALPTRGGERQQALA